MTKPLVTPVHGTRAQLSRLVADWGTALLRCLPPETAHDLAHAMLSRNILTWLGRPYVEEDITSLATTVPGLGELMHPIGLAAGFDKDARLPRQMVDLGFSFLEVGTITPLPQEGNPKPRMFRLPEERALINRMGFNSEGAHEVVKRLRQLKWNHQPVPLGINLGKNKTTPAEIAVEDYIAGLDMFAPFGRYFVINLSSPNTEGLRDLASEHFLIHLAERKRDLLSKIWIKLDPDMPRKPFQRLIEVMTEQGFQGVILTNTHKVSWPEPGGLSGHPLSVASSTRLEWAYEVHKGKLMMIASGGVLSGLDVFEKLARGASAVQIYTALIYRGPFVIMKLLEELVAELKTRRIACVADAIGTHYLD